MYKLEFTLKQHTPLIHFQHDQAGATLRATEVKPKLDKFLVKNIFKNDFDSCKTFLIGYLPNKELDLKKKFEEGFISLNYKLSILSNSGLSYKIGYPKRRSTGEFYWDPQIPCFFGNMGINETQKRKQFVFDGNGINCTLIITDSSLAQHFGNAEKWICLFFLKNNFGNRQDKGFGSFTISIYNGKPINFRMPNCLFFETIDNEEVLHANFAQILNSNGYDAIEKTDWLRRYYSLFKAIDLFYRTLRGGINIPGLYFKSLMFFYAKNLDPEQQWDKKTIRKFFYSEHPKYEEILRNSIQQNIYLKAITSQNRLECYWTFKSLDFISRFAKSSFG
ncbi:MAG: hypothetical protein M1292_07100, partial [Bacteroidetes bacterium]|nr:hypothetical protein [Bacteroidota bacterium]